MQTALKVELQKCLITASLAFSLKCSKDSATVKCSVKAVDVEVKIKITKQVIETVFIQKQQLCIPKEICIKPMKSQQFWEN